ncbi:hypothetical protein BH24ACT3_BH24ACT3_03050 [soil metagenome]
MGLQVVVVQHGDKERQLGDPCLTEFGRRQAGATARWLAGGEPVAAVVSSPLPRAVETAEPIAEALGRPLQLDGRLRERMNWEGIGSQTLEEFLDEWRRVTADRDLVPMSGDSSNAAAGRFHAVLDELVEVADEGRVVVVAHGGVTVDLVRSLICDRALEMLAPGSITDGLPCGGISALRHEHGRWHVDAVGSIAHLPEEGVVVAVSRSGGHTMAKTNEPGIRLLAGLGVEGDAHAGVTVKHRSRFARDPSQPNLRQVHLIHAELHDELRRQGLDVAAGQMGENVTTRGVDLLALPAGTRLHLGAAAVVEVTGLRNPCGQLDGIRPGLRAATLDRDADGGLVRKAGVMAVVLTGGEVCPGDQVAVELPVGQSPPLEPV